MTSTYFIHLQKKLQRLICTKPNRFEQIETKNIKSQRITKKRDKTDIQTDKIANRKSTNMRGSFSSV